MRDAKSVRGRMGLLAAAAAVAAAGLLAVAGGAQAAEYTLVYGGLTRWADINNNNVAVGSTFYDYYFGPKQVIAATVWRNGVSTDISASLGYGYSQAAATGINDHDVIVGYASGTINGTPGAPLPNGGFRYSGTGPLQDAEFLGGVTPGGFSFPAAINNSGVVVGSADGDTGRMAFATEPGGVITPASALGTLGGPQSWARGVNDAGLVVGDAAGASAFGQTPTRAFAYDGTLHDLGSIAPYAVANSAAYGVNSSGAIVGFTDTEFGREAFIHTGTGPLQATDLLGTLGGPQSYGLGINDQGVAVGASSFDTSGLLSAFIYRNGAMVDLNTLVDLPDTFAGFKLTSAEGINNNGWIIGQMSIGGNGYSMGFILAPTAAVPEPTAWALMIGGFGLAGAALRRRRAAAV